MLQLGFDFIALNIAYNGFITVWDRDAKSGKTVGRIWDQN